MLLLLPFSAYDGLKIYCKAVCILTLFCNGVQREHYTGVFDDILRQYASEYELVQVKTTHMGSLFRLTYHMTLRAANQEKQFLDELRCRNGNLEISVSKQVTETGEL